VEGISVKRKTPESYVLRAVMDYLAVRRIFAMRMNSGTVEDKRGVPVRMHEPGTADVLALPKVGKDAADLWDAHLIRPVWIECKAPNGKQSELQKQFEQRVKAEGHLYVLAFGIEDVEKALA
jgi:hypothetical protein